jgi:hypothetical protein
MVREDFSLKHSYTSTRLDGITYSHSRENLKIINALFFRYPYEAIQWTDMNELDMGGLEFNFGIFCESYLPPHIQGYPRKWPVNIWAEVSYMFMSKTGDVNAFCRY